jgi:hypothetical protein
MLLDTWLANIFSNPYTAISLTDLHAEVFASLRWSHLFIFAFVG